MKNVWTCKIGEVDWELLPMGADFPIRQAVAEAYRRLTGKEPNFLFSGWGGQLTEGERKAIQPKESEAP